MTTKEMPFEILPGHTVIIPVGGIHILYQGPTLPPIEVFSNIQVVSAVTSVNPQIDVFYFTGETFLVWSSGPAADTLETMEAGKVYRVNVNVETLWVIPGEAGVPDGDGNGVNIALISAAVIGLVLLTMGKKK